ncbi:MAG: TolC family protein, partial [Thermoanaerobaculia bacterium]
MIFRAFALLGVAAAAVTGQTLTLAEAIDAALASEPSIALAAAESDAAEAAADVAESALDPQVEVTGSAVHHDEPMVVRPIHGFEPGAIPPFDRTLLQSALTARWLLWDGGALRGRAREAEARASAAESEAASIRQEIIARTVAAYLEVVSAAETLAAQDERLAALDAELERVRLLLEVGRAADVELYRAEAARAAAEAERVIASTALDLAEKDLSRLTGLPAARTSAAALASVTAPGAAARAEEVLDGALVTSPRVERLRHALAAEQAALASARGAKRPSVQAASSLLEYGSAEGDFTFEWNAGLHFRFNAWDGGAADERVAIASARVRAAEARLAMVEREIAGAIDAALAEVARAGARVESLARAEAGFAEVARVERLRLETGVGTQAEYL